MKAGSGLASAVSHCFLALFLTLGSANYRHRHEHRIQRKYYEHPWFGNNSIRFCAFNQYLDEHEGRCMIIPGGGTALSIDDNTTCETEALRPHPAVPSSYYACRRTKTILAECRGGQRFENRLKRCAIDVNSSADDFSSADDSPGAYDHISLPPCERPGRFPVPRGNCTVFYACTSNGFRLFRTIYRCPPSTGFDPFTKMCSPKFACDKDDEWNAESSTTKPESKSTTNDLRDAELTSTSSPFNLFTEDEFIKTTTDGIVGAYHVSTISTTQEYENGQTTPSIYYEATFHPEQVPTSEDPFADEINSTEEISTERSSTRDEQSTTTLNVITMDDKNYENQVTLSTSPEYLTTNEANTGYTTLSYSSQDTSEPEKLLTTAKWLFDFSPTEDSTPTEASEPVASTVDPRFTVSSMLFTTAELGASPESSVTETTDVVISTSVAPNEATTSFDEIALSHSETTITSETSTIVEDSAVTDDVTLTTTSENGLFDFASTEESSPRLLTTSEAVPTSDRGTTIQDVITSTTSLPGTESVSASSETLPIDDSVTTTGEWETTVLNMSGSSIENVITTTPIADEYTNADKFFETTTINGAFSGNIDAEDGKTDSTTVPSRIGFSESESTTIVYDDELTKSETTTYVSDSGNTPSSEEIKYNATTVDYEETTDDSINRSDDETLSSPTDEPITDRSNDEASKLPADDFSTPIDSKANEATTTLYSALPTESTETNSEDIDATTTTDLATATTEAA